MAFVPFINCVSIAIRFTFNGIPVEITIGATNGGGISPASMATVGNAVDTWRATYLQPLTVRELVATEVEVRDLTTAASPVVIIPATAPNAGSLGTGDIQGSQVSQVVTFESGLAGRSYRGRNYVPGLGKTALLDSNHWTGASQVAVLNAYGQLGVALNGAGYGHVILSRRHNGAPRATGVGTLVTTYRNSALVETQRRRLK